MNELKRCPRCEESLPLSEFGVCRARKGGLNLYCKRCIRQRIALSRQNLKEYKAAHNGMGPKGKADETTQLISNRALARIMRKSSPADRTREAIVKGARTQTDIAHATKLPIDEVCDAIAQLLLWSRDIRTAVINGMRMYFPIEGDVKIHRSPVRPPPEPRSYGVSPIYSAEYATDACAA